MIGVYVVDDQAIVTDGIAARLANEPGLAVVGIATRLDGAIVAIRRLRPDVVVSDVLFDELPEGLELPRRLRAAMDSPPPVLMLSSFAARYFQRGALERGAAGYLVKNATTAELCAALRTVAAGGTAFAAAIVRPGAAGPRPPSAREREVIIAVSRGGGNDEIGRGLGITSKTVESHLSRMFERYGVSGRTELAVRALVEHWVTTEDCSPARSTRPAAGR